VDTSDTFSTRPPSSEMFGKVREVPQTSRRRSPSQPVWRRQAYGHFLTVNYRESFGNLRGFRNPVLITSLPGEASIRDAQGLRRSRCIHLGLAHELRMGQSRCSARLGLRGRLRARPCGPCCSSPNRPTSWLQPGLPTRSATCGRIAFEHVGLDHEKYRRGG